MFGNVTHLHFKTHKKAQVLNNNNENNNNSKSRTNFSFCICSPHYKPIIQIF